MTKKGEIISEILTFIMHNIYHIFWSFD